MKNRQRDGLFGSLVTYPRENKLLSCQELKNGSMIKINNFLYTLSNNTSLFGDKSFFEVIEKLN